MAERIEFSVVTAYTAFRRHADDCPRCEAVRTRISAGWSPTASVAQLFDGWWRDCCEDGQDLLGDWHDECELRGSGQIEMTRLLQGS